MKWFAATVVEQFFQQNLTNLINNFADIFLKKPLTSFISETVENDSFEANVLVSTCDDRSPIIGSHLPLTRLQVHPTAT